MVNIEIDGISLEAEQGDMIIEVADAAGVSIPRFCYHHKLSVAANCRMCLVEVENIPKAVPACATPVADGMKVQTRSSRAREAQKSVMEFLLINHPLDCPICDQGGECELQDIAMGYGGDVSQFSEGKRVVVDPYIGPLISTEMTRCIHCTRCVRFGTEVAGIRELGATGRGENMSIGTFIEKSVDSEISGNIIDLCPVGALTSKPYRFSARAWEMGQVPSIASHDCLGSHVNIHVRRGEIMRVVPRDCETINECWLSDRDRFSYTGLESKQRLLQPRIKEKGQWKNVEWQDVFEHIVTKLGGILESEGPEQVGFLAHPSSTTEELYLLQKLARGLKVENIDYRLFQQDFSAQQSDPDYPGLDLTLSDVESLDAMLVIGANLRKEQPLLNIRLRKAAQENGAAITLVNTISPDLNYEPHSNVLLSPQAFADGLRGILKALYLLKGDIPPEQLNSLNVDSWQQVCAEKLLESPNVAVILGAQVSDWPNYHEVREVARLIRSLTSASGGELSWGANAAGAAIAGMVNGESGFNSYEMLENTLQAYVLWGIDPRFDVADPLQAVTNLKQAALSICVNTHYDETTETWADVMLPMAGFGETSGTYVNCLGNWQSFTGAVNPPGEARPGWKILRVLGNFMQLNDFNYTSTTEVIDELRGSICNKLSSAWKAQEGTPHSYSGSELTRVGTHALYRCDSLIRHAVPLQRTKDNTEHSVGLNESTAHRLGLIDGQKIRVRQSGDWLPMVLDIDNALADNAVRVDIGFEGSEVLGLIHKPIYIEGVSE